jgi:hypothetical protein
LYSPERVQNEQYNAELLDNGVLQFYKNSTSGKPNVKIDCVHSNQVVIFDKAAQYGASRKYKRTEQWHLTDSQFAVILYGTHDTDFIIDAETETNRKQWCEALHACYLDHSMHHANVLEHKDVIYEENASLQDDRTRKNLSLSFALQEFTVNVSGRDKSKHPVPLASLTISNVLALFNLRRFDMDLDVKLQSFFISDLINNQRVLTSSGSHDLANFKFTFLTDRRSALYDKGSDMYMSLDCSELNALLEPNFVGACAR